MDEHPYIELIERHRAAIGRICRSFGRTVEDREDLRQEILLHLWQVWKRRRPARVDFAWLYRVALNTAIDWRRQRQRQVPTVPLEGFDLPDDPLLREQAAHLRALVAQLPAAERRLIELYLDGFSARESAVLLGISPSNVDTRIGRIKEKLRKMNEQWI